MTMLNAICQFVREEEGASAAEYALLLALITLGIVGAVTALGGAITNALTTATATINASAS
jgi:pilus assembly protein Flp/PilA